MLRRNHLNAPATASHLDPSPQRLRLAFSIGPWCNARAEQDCSCPPNPAIKSRVPRIRVPRILQLSLVSPESPPGAEQRRNKVRHFKALPALQVAYGLARAIAQVYAHLLRHIGAAKLRRQVLPKHRFGALDFLLWWPAVTTAHSDTQDGQGPTRMPYSVPRHVPHLLRPTGALGIRGTRDLSSKPGNLGTLPNGIRLRVLGGFRCRLGDAKPGLTARQRGRTQVDSGLRSPFEAYPSAIGQRPQVSQRARSQFTADTEACGW